MTRMNSSSIRAVDYQSGTSCVQFHASDTIYSHPGVPYSVFVEFIHAPSLGSYYNRYIRGRYR